MANDISFNSQSRVWQVVAMFPFLSLMSPKTRKRRRMEKKQKREYDDSVYFFLTRFRVFF